MVIVNVVLSLMFVRWLCELSLFVCTGLVLISMNIAPDYFFLFFISIFLVVAWGENRALLLRDDSSSAGGGSSATNKYFSCSACLETCYC